MCPLADVRLGLSYLVTPAAVRLGHTLRKQRLMALRRVDIHGLHNDWWANLMLLALLQMVWVNNADWGAIAVACMERHI
jgi:hypothetical protein